MDEGIISRRYATALWMYAQHHRQEDQVYKESNELSRSFTQYSALKRVLSNPILPAGKKARVLYTIAAGERVSEVFSNFIRLVFKNNREEFLQTMCLSFQQIYRMERKILIANLVTAVPLQKDMEQVILERIEKKTNQTVHLNTKVDASILGGYIITLETYRLDTSVTTRLKRIQESLLESKKN